MKFTLSWLKDHLDTKADVQDIADKLTGIGLEVESIEDAGARLKDFTVAEIVSAEKHPNADRLRLCMVNSGDTDPLQIVCGAPNARAGIKVVLARPGMVIPASGEALKVGSIRGVESRGMMCSARELLLGEDHDGIIELPADSKVGAPAAAALGLTDPVIDVSITPNRGDAASVFGVARDLAAAELGTLRTKKVEPVAGKFTSPKRITLDFTPENKTACPLFAGRLIRNVKNGPSPKWVQDRLKAVGMKSISALVDATNLIAQDRGRPLHVFDADKLTGNLHARMAKEGEQVLALDDKSYALDSETVVIADDKTAQGIAGVMGGMESGCSLETTNVFIESAWFEPTRVARAGRKLGIVSDARYRFERGVDPQFVLPGLELCTHLILEWCGGEPSEVVIAGELPSPHKHINFDPSLVETLGGMAVGTDESIRILSRLGFTVIEHGDILHVTPPSYRRDIDGAADLVEEIVRIHGLSGVASTPLERDRAVAKPVLTSAQRRSRTVRRTLAARGFNECVSFSFIAREQARLFGGGDDARELSNPIASDLDALRPSPLPSLLAAASRNVARGFPDLHLFEIGPAFQSGMPEAQTTNAAGIITGAGMRDWTKSGHAANLFDAKAAMIAALEAAMGGPMTAPVTAGAPAWFHPGRSGTIALGPKQLAWFGELHPRILAAFDLKIPVAGFEINLDAIPEPKAKKTSTAFVPSPFQAIERDFAFVVDAKVPAGEIVKAAKMADRALIESVAVFDVYEGKNLGEGKKSIAIAVR
ncbi:MAG TPA: phenylalanine--tRNA ligase subunit beta, partial [Rhizomicrobium sp.]|nr:phenylalanine--tRNA ligase subunit beta [Rhizomicrobium sp.]